MSLIRVVAALLALAAALPAGAQIYRWTDAQGRVLYGSEPPPGARAAPVQDKIQSYSGPAQVTRAAPSGPSAPTGAPRIVMYATSWCPYCAKARDYFARNRIAYTEHDIEKSPAAHAEFKRLGGRGVPLISIGDRQMSGFSEQSFEHALAAAKR